MSVAYTAEQVQQRIKTVPRRRGWWRDKNHRPLLRVGDQLELCPQVRGLARDDREVLVIVRVEDIRREQLHDITPEEVAREGFPGMSTGEFVSRFFIPQGIGPHDMITRIQWHYIDDEQLTLDL